MNNMTVKNVTKPIKVTVSRIVEIFESTNPNPYRNTAIIKNYVYTPEKRVIA